MGGIEAVREAFAYVCELDVDRLTAQTRLDELDADSLVRVAVADLLEQRLGAVAAGWSIDEATLARVSTLGELADVVDRLRSGATVTAT